MASVTISQHNTGLCAQPARWTLTLLLFLVNTLLNDSERSDPKMSVTSDRLTLRLWSWKCSKQPDEGTVTFVHFQHHRLRAVPSASVHREFAWSQSLNQNLHSCYLLHCHQASHTHPACFPSHDFCAPVIRVRFHENLISRCSKWLVIVTEIKHGGKQAFKVIQSLFSAIIFKTDLS